MWKLRSRVSPTPTRAKGGNDVSEVMFFRIADGGGLGVGAPMHQRWKGTASQTVAVPKWESV